MSASGVGLAAYRRLPRSPYEQTSLHRQGRPPCLQGADIVAKVFLGGRTKFLRAADTFYERRREGTISPHPKSTRDLHSGVEKRRSAGEIQRSTFARFFGSLDFRLLQQYLPEADMMVPRNERRRQLQSICSIRRRMCSQPPW
jgi:hypothetical protein